MKQTKTQIEETQEKENHFPSNRVTEIFGEASYINLSPSSYCKII